MPGDATGLTAATKGFMQASLHATIRLRLPWNGCDAKQSRGTSGWFHALSPWPLS